MKNPSALNCQQLPAYFSSYWKYNPGCDSFPYAFQRVFKHCVTAITQKCLRQTWLVVKDCRSLLAVCPEVCSTCYEAVPLPKVGEMGQLTESQAAVCSPWHLLLAAALLCAFSPHWHWPALAPLGPLSTSLPSFAGLRMPTAVQGCNLPSISNIFRVWREHWSALGCPQPTAPVLSSERGNFSRGNYNRRPPPLLTHSCSHCGRPWCWVGVGWGVLPSNCSFFQDPGLGASLVFPPRSLAVMVICQLGSTLLLPMASLATSLPTLLKCLSHIWTCLYAGCERLRVHSQSLWSTLRTLWLKKQKKEGLPHVRWGTFRTNC